VFQSLLRDSQFSFYAVPFIARFAVLHHFLAELLNALFQLCDVLFQWLFHFLGEVRPKLYGTQQNFLRCRADWLLSSAFATNERLPYQDESVG
jgi:hypothetical protein